MCGCAIRNMATQNDNHPSSDHDLKHKTSSADPHWLASKTDFCPDLSTRQLPLGLNLKSTSALEPKGSSHNKNGGQNMLKLGLSSKTCWTGSQLVQLIEKNFETLPAYSSKNKECNKKNGTQFRARMRENRPKQCNVFIKWDCLAEPAESVPNQYNQLKNYETLPIDS